MMGAAALRNLTLLVPLVAVTAAVLVRHHRAELRPRVAGAVLATLLAWVGILAVESAGGWWQFQDTPTTVLGMPLETSLGWALAWGALPVIAGGSRILWLLGFLWVDVLLVPRLDPLVRVGDGWLVGEVLLLGLVAVPSLALGRATTARRALGLRVLLQGLTFGALFGWAAVTLALRRDGLGWADVVDHGFVVRGLLLAGVAVVGVPTLAAVVELWRVGGGTPFPWDPPQRLVSTGPYAYLANPMQTGACALLLLLALAAGSPTLFLGVLVAVVFCVAVADPHERMVLRSRWDAWPDYQRQVRGWLPRWRPVVLEPSTLWVSQTCGLCRGTGDAVRALRPTGVELRAAEESPVRLTRMRWAGAGTNDTGVAALARALEHSTLALAWCGWLVRLPVVRPAVQAVADACGLGPRTVGAPLGTVAR